MFGFLSCKHEKSKNSTKILLEDKGKEIGLYINDAKAKYTVLTGHNRRTNCLKMENYTIE